NGISGQELAARAFTQAEKFGASVAVASGATGLDCSRRPYRVELASGGAIEARAVIVATGARYRRPEVPELARFEGTGVHYGATPNTAWLNGCVPVDAKGFVKTGIDLQPADLTAARWPLARSPYPLETALPAVFAVGDVRAASVKRVAAAVGEGSACVQQVHK